jgi:hypothetical protein
MPHTRLRTRSPSGQAEPATQLHEWSADGIAFELWANGQTGFILADPGGGFEPVAHVDICGSQMSIVWHGPITDRPQSWLNAQKAIAARAYFGGPDE